MLFLGGVVALIRSHMNGLQPVESTIEQTTEPMPPSPTTIPAAAMIKQKQVTTTATLLFLSVVASIIDPPLPLDVSIFPSKCSH